MDEAPPLIGERFVKAVRERNVELFQYMVLYLGYSWMPYFRQLEPEDQLWAVMNRPMEPKPEFGFRRAGA